jgi:hypothetical protein
LFYLIQVDHKELQRQEFRFVGLEKSTESVTQRLVLSQPSVEKRLMAHCVQSRHNNIGSRNLVRLNLNLRHLIGPWLPLSLNADLLNQIKN